MRSLLKKLSLSAAAAVAIVLTLHSCGEEGPMFNIATVGSFQQSAGEQVLFANDDRRSVNSHATLVTRNAAGETRLKDIEFYDAHSGKVQYALTDNGDIADWGGAGATVVAAAESFYIPDASYLLVMEEGNGNLRLIDFYGKTAYPLGNYNFGVFWIHDNTYSRQQLVAQALVMNSTVVTDSYGVRTVIGINEAALYHLDTKVSASWTKMEGAFDNLPGGEQFFEGASNIVIAQHSEGTAADYGSTVVLIDANGRLKYLETNNIANNDPYRFTDRTTERVGFFTALDLPVRHFSQFIESDAASVFTRFCLIAASQKNPARSDLYTFAPNADGSSFSAEVAAEDVYSEGTCSAAHYIRTSSVTGVRQFVPWITYHSAKNELSVAVSDRATGKYDSFVLAKGKSANWVFAEKINSIAKSGGNNNAMFILFNDGEALKIAGCNDQKRCGFDSSL